MNYITISGARQHNLKNINLKIPRESLVVVTGVSGSGKSSIAYDTLFAEGQRRFMESLSSYARQFVEKLDKPDLDSIEGLSPSISVDQKSFQRNPRSTVGTITEIYDYLRLLFTRIGKPYCYNCGNEIIAQSVDSMVDRIIEIGKKRNLTLYSPIIQGRKGEHRKELEDLRKEGFLRVRIDGNLYELEDEIDIDKNKKHNIELVVDYIEISGQNSRDRLEDSLRLALKRSGGFVNCEFDDNYSVSFSETHSCPNCGISYPEVSPRLFSFNSPYGACKECNGLGKKTFFDPDLIIQDPSKSIKEGTISPWRNSSYYKKVLQCISDHYGFKLDTPYKKLPAAIKEKILYGSGNEKIKFYRERKKWFEEYYDTFPGVIGSISKWYQETDSDEVREKLSKYIQTVICEECKGSRLTEIASNFKISDKSIHEITQLPIDDCFVFFNKLKIEKREQIISERILKEIRSRLEFLLNVGLNYLSLDRAANTLSGGEAQRIRLATQLGSKLTGITYILDEPSIGLHPKDNNNLINTLKSLRDSGNSVIVIEHDEDTIRNSDYIVDLGPGAGEKGGELVVAGKLKNIIGKKSSLTGKYLSGNLSIEIPEKRRTANDFLTLKGARANNLKNIDVKVPLGLFTCVTGVSGSGKSTLVIDILYNSLSKNLYKSKKPIGTHKEIFGFEKINKIIDVDQNPIGRTPRSNPGTYIGLFTYIREFFSMLPESRIRGYTPSRFSFNLKEGSCGLCKGDGNIKIEMHFLPDVYVKCDQCSGKRYNPETLEIKFKDKTISDVLNMTVSQALEFFENVPQIKEKLKVINEVGLDYIKLGQNSTTLSGGEAQRIKLAKELSKKSTGKTLYILDEPSVGLHFDDIKKLLNVIQKLVDLGNTVIVIEHNLDIIKCSDYVVDLGPEGGNEGGYLVAEGTPEKIAINNNSYTGKYLSRIFH